MEDNASVTSDDLVNDFSAMGIRFKVNGKEVTEVTDDNTKQLGESLANAVIDKLVATHGPLDKDKFGFILKKDSSYNKAIAKKNESSGGSDCGILVVGPSQHGKSTLINFILKGERVPKTSGLLKVGNGLQSCTTDCFLCTSNYNGVHRNLRSQVLKYDIIDTPGLMDSSSENEFLNALSVYDTLIKLKEKTKLNCVVLVIKYNTIISDALLKSLRTYKVLLGDLFEETLCVVFSDASYHPDVLEQLKEDGEDRQKILYEALLCLQRGLDLRQKPRYFALNSKPMHKNDIQVALQVRQCILDLASQTSPFEKIHPRIAKTEDIIAEDKVEIAATEGDLKGYLQAFEETETQMTGIKGKLSFLAQEASELEKKIAKLSEELGDLAGDNEALITQLRYKPENCNPWRNLWPWKKAKIRTSAKVDIHDFLQLNCYTCDEKPKIDRNTGKIVVYSRFMRTFKYSEVCVRAKKVKFYSQEIENLKQSRLLAKSRLDKVVEKRHAELERMGLETGNNKLLKERIESARSKLEKLRSPFLTPDEAVRKVPVQKQRRELHRVFWDCNRLNLS